MKKLEVIFVVLLFIFSAIASAFADKGDSNGKSAGESKAQGKGSDSGGRFSKDGRGNAKGEEAVSEKRDKTNETANKSAREKIKSEKQEKREENAESTGAADRGKVKSEKEVQKENGNNVTLGEYISAIEKARRDQWKITRKQLREMGYRGSMSEFATAFNEYINSQKKEIREKILNSSSENLSLAVVNTTVKRELANLTQQLISNMSSVSDANLSSALMQMINQTLTNQTQTNETNATLLGGIGAVIEELPLMSEEFKKRLYFIAVYGEEEEREELEKQFKKLAAAKGRVKRED